MSIIKRFNNLDGKTVRRKTIESILRQAKKQKHTEITRRLTTLLNSYENDVFSVELIKKIEETSNGLGIGGDRKKKCPVHLAEGFIPSHISNAQEFQKFRDFDTKMRKYLNVNKNASLDRIFKQYNSASHKETHHKDTKKNENTKKQGLGVTALHPDTIAFNKAILKAKREGVKPLTIFKLGTARDILKKYAGDNVITISGAVVKKAMTKDSDHIMSWDNFINLPDYLNNPIAVFKSRTKSKAKVVLTEVKTYKEKPLMVALHLNGNLKISRIASVYNRKYATDYKKWIEEGLCEYMNKKSFHELLPGIIPISHTTKGYHKDTKKNGNTKKTGLGATALHPDTIAFNKAILKAKREGIKPRQYIRLGETKGVLLNTLGEKQMRIAGATINKSMKKDSDHIMQWDNFINLPDYVNNPIAIFKSKSIGYVVLTEVFNKKNKPLMIPLHIVKKGRFLELKSLYSKTDDKIYLDWVREGLLLYINKKSELLFKVFKGLIPSVDNNSHHKDTKKNEKNKNLGLPEVEIEILPLATKSETPPHKVYTPDFPVGKVRKGSLAEKLKALKSREFEYFDIGTSAIKSLLGSVEKKNKESVVITIAGAQGSMKTRFAFQFINAMAHRYHVGHASIEEHPDSSLYYEKAIAYIKPDFMGNVSSPEVQSLIDLDDLIQKNDVVVIDSYAKLKEIDSKFEIDKDLRKKYDGKLFLIVFQQTTDGKMRGGSKSQFDGDIVLFVEKMNSYKDNYVFCDKNRYNSTPLDELHYNIYRQEIIQPEKTEESIKEKPIYEFSF